MQCKALRYARADILALLVMLATPGLASAGDKPPCKADMQVGTKCACAIDQLHPLQAAVGMSEVDAKASALKSGQAKPNAIRIVFGSDHIMYITDHHHEARALLDAGQNQSMCLIKQKLDAPTMDAFWTQLQSKNLVWLFDTDGHPIQPEQLPSSVALLKDDPYRSLAGVLRDPHMGFARDPDHPEFAEFYWANFLRDKIGGGDPAALNTMIATNDPVLFSKAVALAGSDAASAVPGFCGKDAGTPACKSAPEAP